MLDPNYEAKKRIFEMLAQKGLTRLNDYDEFRSRFLTKGEKHKEEYLRWKESLPTDGLVKYNEMFGE